jgi:hypothetical protein
MYLIFGRGRDVEEAPEASLEENKSRNIFFMWVLPPLRLFVDVKDSG